MTALAGVELESLVSEPDALTNPVFRCFALNVFQEIAFECVCNGNYFLT